MARYFENSVSAAGPDSSRKRSIAVRLIRIVIAAVILIYFIRFVTPGLDAGFNGDDPMNIYYYWSRGAGKLLRNLPLFFTTYQRPMGGVYFSALYHFFDLNPLPYHIVITALLLLNTFLSYRFARLITGSELAGGLTALVMAYHAKMPHLVYLPAFIFDVLCFTFYLLALNYYVSARSRRESLKLRQIAAFLLLYVCALDSKEMAFTLPLIVLAYEALWHGPKRIDAAAFGAWLKGNAVPGLIAGVMTVVFVLGKTFGSDSLVRMPAYRPTFTWSRYWESTSRFVNEIFYQPDNGFFEPWRIAVLAVALLFVAWRWRQKHLLLMWCFVWIAPLPITFVPDRGGGMLYIPLLGWAVIAVSLFLGLSNAAARLLAAGRVPAPVTVGVLVALGAAGFWANTANEDATLPEGIRHPGQLTWSMVEQVRAVQPRVKPGSQIYVTGNPFEGWEVKFIFELVYHDRSVNVWLSDKYQLPPDEIERMDYIFAIEDGKLKRLKGPKLDPV